MDFMLMFDRQYADEGLICLNSIKAQSATSTVYVLCLQDQIVPDVEAAGGIPLLRQNVEAKFPSIGKTRFERPWAPYVQSLKPFLPEYIYSEYPEADVLTYVDSDFYFWGDPAEIDTEFGDHSFMVTPHGTLAACFFNGGCFTCRNDRKSLDFLAWWQGKCVEWCLWGPGPNGAFSEEGYLNIIRTEPTRFEGTHVCTHPGINTAPWNINGYDLQQVEGGFTVDGRPLVCYHYRGYVKRTEAFQYPVDAMPEATADLLYRPYHELLPVCTWPEG